jgi:hypothetical protein
MYHAPAVALVAQSEAPTNHADRLDALRNALAVYRLAFGQAREEDVINHLLRRLGPDQLGSPPANFGST